MSDMQGFTMIQSEEPEEVVMLKAKSLHGDHQPSVLRSKFVLSIFLNILLIILCVFLGFPSTSAGVELYGQKYPNAGSFAASIIEQLDDIDLLEKSNGQAIITEYRKFNKLADIVMASLSDVVALPFHHEIDISEQTPKQILASYPIVERALSWVATFDEDQNALLCSHEIRKMPDFARAFIPRFDRIRREKEDGRLCLRYMQIEAVLYSYSHEELSMISGFFSDLTFRKNTNRKKAYKFQDVADFLRHVHYPYTSTESLEALATFTYHGQKAYISKNWKPSDVQPGDIVAVRGPGVSWDYWKNIHPYITNPYVVYIFTEGEDVTPGIYASRLEDETIGAFFTMNLDEKTARHPKLHPIPIGHLWRTNSSILFTLAQSAPPLLDPSRSIDVLILFTDHAGRLKVRQQLRENFKGSPMLVESGPVDGSIEVLKLYAKTKFVVSPFGTGPDCHRHWESLAMNAVPIILKHKGIGRLFEGEPVLEVDHWSDVTPKLIEGWSTSFKSKAQYQYYWQRKILEISRSITDQI